MTHGSLFAGIGGFDLGFQWAGIETVWQVEIDDYCRQVLARHFPEAERFSDIRDCGAHNLRPVDIISGGFPCQDISVAGKQQGIKGSRSGLWSEMHRVISEIRPRSAVIENVPNLARLGLDRVLADLASIGYDAEWQCISANDVGALHLRKRIWIVAYAGHGKRSVGIQCEQQNRTRTPSGLGYGGSCSEIMADPTSQRRGEMGKHSDRSPERFTECGKIVAYPPTIRREGDRSVAARQYSRQEQTRSYIEQGSPDVADTEGTRREVGRREVGGKTPHTRFEFTSEGKFGTAWSVEPDLGRVAHGVPSRVDRLKGLGNAIVPQIAEIIGRRLMEIEA